MIERSSIITLNANIVRFFTKAKNLKLEFNYYTYRISNLPMTFHEPELSMISGNDWELDYEITIAYPTKFGLEQNK